MRDIPGSALLLGWAGVLPFAALALVHMLGAVPWGMPRPLEALVVYGGVILSFMGGAQWGLAVAPAAHAGVGTTGRRLAVSVLPALLAAPALLIGGAAGLMMLAAGFAALLAYDLWTVRADGVPAWYGRLRAQLTAAVLACLAVAITKG